MYAPLTLYLTPECSSCLMTLGSGASNSCSGGCGRMLTQEENPAG